LVAIASSTGRLLVDVIAPDDKPFVPGPDHPHEAHADTADIGAGLHHPVEHLGRWATYLDRSALKMMFIEPPTPIWPSKGSFSQLRHHGIAAIRADEVFRPDGELLARQAVATGGGHAVGVLFMAEILGRHPGLCAARAGSLEQQRLHEGLRQVVHHRWEDS
jgi:hypothetical protein